MKKALLLSFLSLIAFSSFSQTKFSLKFSPGLALSRVSKVDTGYSVNNNGIGVRFSFGPEVNFFFTDNVAFVTGLYYTSRRAGLKFSNPGLPVNKEVYNLQYLQIPAQLKFYTNDIATDMKLYFNLGGTLDIKLAEKNIKTEHTAPYIKDFTPIDATVLVGAGVQLQMGDNTFFTGGLSYNRGLINSVRNMNNTVKALQEPRFNLNTDFLALDLGIRF